MAVFDAASSLCLWDPLDGLLAAWEDEVIECKRAESSFDTDRLALSNEAALRGFQSAWMLLGIDDRSHSVVDTSAFSRPGLRNELKQKIAEHSSTKGTFRDIHEVDHPDGRVLFLEIPAAPRGQAVAWKGHFYGRSGESLGALPLDKLDDHLFPLLSDALSAEQKRNKVHNLLAKLRHTDTVTNAGTRRKSRWTLL